MHFTDGILPRKKPKKQTQVRYKMPFIKMMA